MIRRKLEWLRNNIEDVLLTTLLIVLIGGSAIYCTFYIIDRVQEAKADKQRIEDSRFEISGQIESIREVYDQNKRIYVTVQGQEFKITSDIVDAGVVVKGQAVKVSGDSEVIRSLEIIK